MAKCDSIKLQFSRMKKCHNYEKIYLSFSRLSQLYACFLWVTLPTGNVEIKYSELLQNPIS